jgi:selenocysteine lyase/cysteine desulfurase
MSTGVIAFQVKGIEGAHISNELRARKIITRPTGLKFSGVRVSISFFNTQAELDALVNAVTEIVATDTR